MSWRTVPFNVRTVRSSLASPKHLVQRSRSQLARSSSSSQYSVTVWTWNNGNTETAVGSFSWILRVPAFWNETATWRGRTGSGASFQSRKTEASILSSADGQDTRSCATSECTVTKISKWQGSRPKSVSQRLRMNDRSLGTCVSLSQSYSMLTRVHETVDRRGDQWCNECCQREIHWPVWEEKR